MNLSERISQNRTIRVIGFDDAHYADKTPGSQVNVSGVVCARVRFEGMVWGNTTVDGMTATEELIRLFNGSKFAYQTHLILLDGLTMGGCNVIDLPLLAAQTGLPAVAVMRRLPNIVRLKKVIDRMQDADERWRRVQAAGPVHEIDGFFFQVSGETPETIAIALRILTDHGKVPEALRLAHLIGGAVMKGESGKRA